MALAAGSTTGTDINYWCSRLKWQTPCYFTGQQFYIVEFYVL
jgi:hypothetical protein